MHKESKGYRLAINKRFLHLSVITTHQSAKAVTDTLPAIVNPHRQLNAVFTPLSVAGIHSAVATVKDIGLPTDNPRTEDFSLCKFFDHVR